MGERFRRFRAGIVARARLVEDIVAEQVDRGHDQYVIGRTRFLRVETLDLVRQLRVFEVDEPSTQMWKRHRLDQLGIEPPEALSFVPVNFETQSWVEEIVRAGFDRARPAVVSSTGVTQLHAVSTRFRPYCTTSPGSRRVGSCVWLRASADLIEPDEREMHAEILRRAAARGHPWLSLFRPTRSVGSLEKPASPAWTSRWRTLFAVADHRARRWAEARKFSRLNLIASVLA